MQFGIGPLCLIYGIVAFAVVHRVVVYQSHLVACQLPLAVSVQQACAHGTVPQTCLQHASAVVLAFADDHLVGCAEDEGAVAAVGHVVECSDDGVVPEQGLLAIVIQDEGYLFQGT